MTTDTKPSPMVDALTKAASGFVSAKAGQVVGNLGDKLSGQSDDKSKGQDQDRDQDQSADDGEESKGLIGNVTEKIGEGASPVGAAVKGLGSTIKDKVGGLFKRKGGSKRPHNIVEDIIVGVPPEVCWVAFTEWEEFPSFMKGPTSVTRGDEVPEDELEEGQHPLEGEQTNWNAKIFLSKRSWKATTVDYDPPNRLSWTSEGAKGTVDGTITFTPIGENATLMAVEIEYRSKGIMEWMGQRWHAVGKRVRLDMKHFRRYVMRTEPEDLDEKVEDSDDIDTEEPTDEQPDEGTEEPTDEESEVTEEPDEPDEEPEVEEPEVEEPETEPETGDEEAPEPEPGNEAEEEPRNVRRERPVRRARA